MATLRRGKCHLLRPRWRRFKLRTRARLTRYLSGTYEVLIQCTRQAFAKVEAGQAPIAWFFSHCKAHSGRDKYISWHWTAFAILAMFLPLFKRPYTFTFLCNWQACHYSLSLLQSLDFTSQSLRNLNWKSHSLLKRSFIDVPVVWGPSSFLF